MGLLVAPPDVSDTDIIFDCRSSLADRMAGRRAYATAHLPGARFADLEQDLSSEPGSGGRHPLPERSRFAGWLAANGVNSDSRVVCYDQNSGAFAARLWWLVRWAGHENVAVLDGGLDAWRAAGLPLTDEIPAVTAGDFTLSEPLTRQVSAGELHQDHRTLLDARERTRYLGESEPIDPVAGHIPGALCAPFADNLSAGRFRSAADLNARFRDLGIETDSDVVCYCGSGVTAAHNILALRLAGYREPALYPGSWSEWITDPARPIATTDQ